MNQWEREYQQLEEDHASGLLTRKQFDDQAQALDRAMRDQARAEAEEAAEQAYNDAMERWS